MIYTTLPAFQTGDLVSASRLNQIADNLDACTGLEGATQIAYDSGADYATNGGLYTRGHGYPGWAGKQMDAWIAHNGNQIKVYHGGVGTPTNAVMWYDYDGANEQGPFDLSPSVEHTITINAAPFYQYQPVRIHIQQADMNAATSLWVRSLYQTSSTRPTALTLPPFTNGTVSSAADFNALLDDTDKAYLSFNQPVASFFHMPFITWWPPSGDGGAKGGTVAWIQHRHDTFSFDAVINGPNNTTSDDYAYWTYNGQVIWQITLSKNGSGTGPKNPGNGKYKWWDGSISISLSGQGLTLTPGNWYKLAFYIHRTQDYDREENACLWSFGEQPDNHILSAPSRWTHGDLVEGSGDRIPRLNTFTAGLTSLQSKLRWYNPACRQATSRMSPDTSDNEVVDQMASFRVHRWLAYENFKLVTGERSNAQIQWRTGAGRALQSYSLPTVEGPSFFDLESTPIKPGMYMRMSGVKFAIQVPQPGEYDYA